MNITKTTPSSSIISGCVVWPQLKVPEEIVKMWKNIHENVIDVRLDSAHYNGCVLCSVLLLDCPY